METVVVVLIVGAAVAWAGREVWRALRPRPSSSCGCPSAGRCAVARNCSQAAPTPSAAPAHEPRSAGRQVS